MYEDSVFWLQALREFEKLVSAIATIADLSEISAWNTTLFLFFRQQSDGVRIACLN